MHAPKVTYYDLEAQTHILSKGAFAVDCYEKSDGWLYLARPFVSHPHIAYMEAYLLPALGLQVNRWQHHPGSAYAWYDFYVDVMAVKVDEACWTSRDFYLDIVVVEGRAAYIIDTDEFLAAQTEGLLTPDESAYALSAAHNLLNGLAKCGYSLHSYLETQGLTLTWHR